MFVIGLKLHYASGLNGFLFFARGGKKYEHFMCFLLNYSTIYIIINCFDRLSSFVSGWEIGETVRALWELSFICWF